MRNDSRRPADQAAARIAPLAKLPLFFDLGGKEALVAGGSDGAAWKAELLAAAGACVIIFSECPGEEMTTLIERDFAFGAVVLKRRRWSESDLAGKVIALCDAGDVAEARAFYTACHAAGVPCNVIDRPMFCDFFFGSIVNRSPVVVGISTDGAAPILGQAIRMRIEALLPLALTGWAAAAKTLRSEVAARLKDANKRRRFWEGFVQMAFTRIHDERSVSDLRELAARVTCKVRSEGQVSVFRVGPDPEHLTLKAARALQSADLVLFDDFVSAEVLELSRREAKRVRIADGNWHTPAFARRGQEVVVLRSIAPACARREASGPQSALPLAANLRRTAVPQTSRAACDL